MMRFAARNARVRHVDAFALDLAGRYWTWRSDAKKFSVVTVSQPLTICATANNSNEKSQQREGRKHSQEDRVKDALQSLAYLARGELELGKVMLLAIHRLMG
jgi:hypothetical protein